MLAKVAVALALLVIVSAGTYIHCICFQESGCKPTRCHMDAGSLSCGYYQIKLPYYQDCGEVSKKSGQNVSDAWKRCADDYNCATQCVQNYYNRYKKNCASPGGGTGQTMARNHNGVPAGCKNSNAVGYRNHIHKCCGCA